MSFDEYIKRISEVFTVKKQDDNEYYVHKNRRVYKVTPLNMPSMQELNDYFTHDVSTILDNSMNYNNKRHSDCHSTNTSMKQELFMNIGEDDLHPSINRRQGRPKGSIFDPSLFEQKSDDDIIPFKKTGPDNDHLPKPGDDDNPFMH